MTTYTRPLVNGTPTTGGVVEAGHVNEPIDQIYDTILAGGITSDQIAVGAVDTSELATAAVTEAKLATAAVTAAKMDGTLPDGSAMATSTAPTLDAQLANKKYVDDVVAAKGLESWDDSRVVDTTYEATKDLFVCVSTTSQNNILYGYTGAVEGDIDTPIASYLRVTNGMTSSGEHHGLMMPVKGGDFWKIVKVSGAGATIKINVIGIE